MSPTHFCTASINGKGTKMATSAGEEGLTAFAIPVASSMASCLEVGFNFQFPVIRGFRAERSVGRLKAMFCETKAEDRSRVPRASRRDAKEDFMVYIVASEDSLLCVLFMCKGVERGISKKRFLPYRYIQ
jgi:hypothetical protein